MERSRSIMQYSHFEQKHSPTTKTCHLQPQSINKNSPVIVACVKSHLLVFLCSKSWLLSHCNASNRCRRRDLLCDHVWSSPCGNCMGIIWDFPHVPLMWFLCKHTERSNQQPLIIMVGRSGRCFLCQVSSRLLVRHHIHANPGEPLFNCPQTSYMWQDLY